MLHGVYLSHLPFFCIDCFKYSSCQISQEILYTEMDHGDVYENDLLEFDDGIAESRKVGSVDMVTVADIAEPLEVHNPTHDDAATDDDQDLNFLDDDDLTD